MDTRPLSSAIALETSIPAQWEGTVTLKPQVPIALNSIAAVLPSLGDFAWLMPLLFLFGRMNGAPGLLGDGDSGWHIRTGEWILAHRQVPMVDTFSYTRPGQPWFAWEWLSEVLMGAAHQTGGMQAVLLGAMFVICLTFFLLYRLILRTSGNVLIAFGLTTLAAGGAAIHWLARPHLFTMLLTVVFCSILERKRLKLLVWLPLLTILWTNLHGGFIAGILITAAWAAGEAISSLLTADPDTRRASLRRSGAYALATAGCMAASFINPYGWHLHQHVATYLTNPAYFENIAEFLSISFRHPLAPFFELMLILSAATAFWNLTQRRFIPVFLLAGWAHLALLSVRNIPLFVLVAAAPIGVAVASWLRDADSAAENTSLRLIPAAINGLTERLRKADQGPHWYVAGPLCLLLLGRAMYSAAPAAPLRAEYHPQNYPAAALSTLRATDRIFTTDTWGGYLIYKRPSGKVFVDGRSDFYGPEFEKQYNDVMNVRYNWQSVLRQYAVDTVVLPVNAALASTLKLTPGWSVVFDDGHAIVFRTVAPQLAAGNKGSN